MKGMNLDLKPPTPHRQQYSIAELKALREAARGPYEQWAIHLEQDYGVRRITVIRARLEDFDKANGVVILRVKGRGGTKTMETPLNPETVRYLDAAERQREEVIASCRDKGYTGPIPPEVMLVKWDGVPKPVCGTSLDNLLMRVCARAGVKYRGHHANRRGVAAAIYAETKDLVATQEFLGHADPKTTEMYIGTGLERQRKAQNALAKVFASAAN
jgi:integrase